jgi:hypothetical protein
LSVLISAVTEVTALRAVRGPILLQQHKVLRTWVTGFHNRVAQVRTSNEHESDFSLAVKGDALIHGPNMAARPVGSDWRTRRPSQGSIQPNN